MVQSLFLVAFLQKCWIFAIKGGRAAQEPYPYNIISMKGDPTEVYNLYPKNIKMEVNFFNPRQQHFQVRYCLSSYIMSPNLNVISSANCHKS